MQSIRLAKGELEPLCRQTRQDLNLVHLPISPPFATHRRPARELRGEPAAATGWRAPSAPPQTGRWRRVRILIHQATRSGGLRRRARPC
ncbi:hypothetical protein SBBP2_220021 [Burkholderiales bacterium]|nr:hypothetical protein SBBP2_220021 [Burkholderiales bacterium]